MILAEGMTAQDVILGIVMTSGVIGMAIGMVVGMLGQSRFGCETCHQRMQAEARAEKATR